MKQWKWIILVWLLGSLWVAGPAFPGTSDMETLMPSKTTDGWVAQRAPQSFNKETLFEHIDGQADLFLHYGFQKSIFAVFENQKASKEKIDLDIYDMGDPVSAFGVFSRFRQENRPVGIGFDSYADDQSAFFYKGKYFVVLQGTETSETGLKQLAQTVASKMTDKAEPPKELKYFPQSGLKPGSTEYYPEGLMGRQFLKKGFKATYMSEDKAGAQSEANADEKDRSLFIAIYDTSGQAESALKSFEEVLAKNGKTEVLSPVEPGCQTVKGNDAYQGQIILVQKGPYLVGSAGFEQEKRAKTLLGELIRNMK